jgi:putative endonuclease
MQDNDYLVFVEVRYRKNADFGGALESIDYRKQGKLRRTAEFYLQKHKRTESPCRFDILCLSGQLSNPDINWIKNAF